MFKIFVNGTEIPLTPPLPVGNQFVTDFLIKVNLLNDYFSEQCTTVDNDSSAPPNVNVCNLAKTVYF